MRQTWQASAVVCFLAAQRLDDDHLDVRDVAGSVLVDIPRGTRAQSPRLIDRQLYVRGVGDPVAVEISGSPNGPGLLGSKSWGLHLRVARHIGCSDVHLSDDSRLT
mgnify:CR=1 FL=1